MFGANYSRYLGHYGYHYPKNDDPVYDLLNKLMLISASAAEIPLEKSARLVLHHWYNCNITLSVSESARKFQPPFFFTSIH
jgi:hypothetical protein